VWADVIVSVPEELKVIVAVRKLSLRCLMEPLDFPSRRRFVNSGADVNDVVPSAPLVKLALFARAPMLCAVVCEEFSWSAMHSD
jgi:hypothetical protein